MPPPDTALNTTRLRLNRLLNLSGKNGRAAGHTLGVLGLFFSSAESLIGYFNDPSVPDAVNSVVAGICTSAGPPTCVEPCAVVPLHSMTVTSVSNTIGPDHLPFRPLTGALSGALYRAPRGLRTAGVAGGIGAVAASALVYARNNLSNGL
jgi:hypothetical protein